MTRSACISLCYLCALISCDFKPDGEVFTTVDLLPVEGLVIDLKNYPDETIELKGKTEFRYSVETQSKKLIETRALLDDVIISASPRPDGTFVLDPAEMETGSHKLRIEFAVASETGSLADRLGAEFISVWTERTVLVDHTIPENAGDANAIFISNVENVDYSVKVIWTEYGNFNFEKYEVLRRDYDEMGNLKSESAIPAMSADANHTYLFDHMYVGGKSEYMIKLYAAGKTYTSPPFAYEHTYKPDISYAIKGDGNVTITWRSLSALRNNFNAYKLEVIDFVDGVTDQVTFDFTSLTDTTITFMPENFRFGKFKQLRLTIYPILGNSSYMKMHRASMRYGDPFPVFDPYGGPLRFNVDTWKFYYITPRGYLSMANENGEPLDSLWLYSDHVLINNNIGIRNENGYCYLIDLETIEEEGQAALPRGTVYALSDDNKLFFYTTHGVRIVSLDGVELLSLGFPASDAYKGISANGQYVFAPPEIYRFNGTLFENWVSWSGFNILTASYPPQEPTKVIFGEKDQIRKYNIETNEYEVISTAYTGPCNLDPVTNMLGCLNGDQFVILNADDLQLYKALPVQADAGLFYLLNSKVLCSSGTQIELSAIP